jgi:hypothetical protein
MRTFGPTLAMTTVALKLGLFHIVSVRTVGAAVLLCGWNQALAQLVSAFMQAFCIPNIVHNGSSSPGQMCILTSLNLATGVQSSRRASNIENNCLYSAYERIIPFNFAVQRLRCNSVAD